MPDLHHVEAVRAWADTIAQWRAVNPDVEMDLGGADLRGFDLQGIRLGSAPLVGANLPNARFTQAKLPGVNLADANLDRADLGRASLASADLSGAKLTNVNLFWADIKGANLEGTVLRKCRMICVSLIGASPCQVDFSQSNMIEADQRNPYLTGALFVSTNMNSANLLRRSMTGANFDQASLHRADFTPAKWHHTTTTFPKGFDPNNVEFLDVGV